MKIVICNGFYATNIGNAFYMNGARYLLRTCFPQAEIYSLGDVSPNQWRGKKCLRNDFVLYKYIDVDYLVIMGPCLSKDIAKIRSYLLHVLRNKKTKLVLLSVGGSTYDKDEIKICRNFLKKCPPFMLFTRDQVAYDYYHDLAEISYNGICTAWFVNDYFKAVPVNMPPYITMVFDKLIEPQVKISGSLNAHVQDSQIKIKFPLTLPDKGLVGKITRRISPYLLPFISKNYAERIGDYKIIRPTHKISYRYSFELFSKKNVYVSEIPDGYLNLYKYTSLNLTDRVHSAVVSLAFGRPTRLFTKSKRANLFARVGAESVTERITYLNENKLVEEKEKFIEKLRSSILK